MNLQENLADTLPFERNETRNRKIRIRANKIRKRMKLSNPKTETTIEDRSKEIMKGKRNDFRL